MKRLRLPLRDSDIGNLRAGEILLLSGAVYTARDAAHKRLFDLLKKGRKLPIALKNQAFFYTGPTPAPKGKVIGSCGPTTSSRMDEFTPVLLRSGLRVMIGKGERSKNVIDAIRKNKAVYLLALAGCGALLSKHVEDVARVAYSELKTEAIFKLTLKDFPIFVGVDSKGKSVFRQNTTSKRKT